MQEIKKINLSLEWDVTTIGELCSNVSSGGTPKSTNEEYYGGNIPWLNTKEINFNRIYDTEKHITNEGFKNSAAKWVKKDSVIVAMYGATAAKVAMNMVDLTTNQACCNLTIDKSLANPKFVYYYLYSNYERLLNLASGAAQQNLNSNIIKEFPINIPSLNVQNEIVNLLSTIDDKIELNQKVNKNLEKTLITIFNSWFINFENYDNSKGMKIDDSYEIPVDWSVEMLDDYVDFVTGVEPGSKNYHEKPEPNDIPFLRVGDLGSRDNGVFIDPSLSKNKILKYDDIVLSLDATIGIVKMGLEGAYSTGMRKLVIKNDNINQPFLYCLVKSNRIQRIIETFATGTTILHAGKSIKHMNFVLSDKKTMDDFGKIGNLIISIILTNLKEIEYLTNLRDTLLPKLMSGEIDVSKINCDLKIIIRKIYIKSSKLFLWRYLSENQNYIKNTKSNETLLKSRTIHKINKFLAKFNARYRYYRQQ